jgi:ribosome-associated translation inhibitor RaiA
MATSASRADTNQSPAFELHVVTRGFDDDRMVAYAREKILDAVRAAPRPVLFARLKLTQEPHRSVERPSRAEVMLDLDGRAVRAHVAARDMTEAADLLEQRLRRKLKEFEQRSEFLRRFTGVVEQGEWRHRDEPTHRPGYYPRPPEERQVVRRKTLAVGRLGPEEAVLQMEMLDHDFHLFIDASTEQDAVVRSTSGGYELIRAEPSEVEPTAGISLSPAQPAHLDLDQAVELLNLSGQPFVFFISESTSRGNVLYRRYDGHYGLITPT